MSALLLPHNIGSEVDFREHFSINSKQFYLLGIIFCVIDFSDAFLEKMYITGFYKPPQLVFIGIYLIFFLLGDS